MQAHEFNTNHVPTDRAAQRGYDGIELALLRADGTDVPEMKRLLAVTRMEIPYIPSGQVFAADRLYFTHPDPHLRESAGQRFIGMIRLAAEFGAKVNGCPVRRLIQKAETAETANHVGVELIVEPLNRYEVNFINNCMEGWIWPRLPGKAVAN